MKRCAYCGFEADEPDFGAHVRSVHPGHFLTPPQEPDLLVRFHADAVLGGVLLLAAIGFADTASSGGPLWMGYACVTLFLLANIFLIARPIRWSRKRGAITAGSPAVESAPTVSAAERKRQVRMQGMRAGAVLSALAALAFLRPSERGIDWNSFGVAMLIIWAGVAKIADGHAKTIKDDPPTAHQREVN